MLRKLLKYDFSALSKTLVPVSLGAILASLFAVGLMAAIDAILDSAEWALSAVGVLSVFILTVVAMSAYFVVAIIFVIRQFYKSCFTSQGYLTFTLPVRTVDVLWSKVISSSVWMLFSLVIEFCCFALLLIAARFLNGPFSSGFFSGSSILTDASFSLTGESTVIAILTVISFLFSVFSSVIVFFLCLTVGNIIAKKHQVWASIGVWAGINIVISIIKSIFTVIFTVSLLRGTSTGVYDSHFVSQQYILSTSFDILLSVILFVCCFLLCDNLLKKKINIV